MGIICMVHKTSPPVKNKDSVYWDYWYEMVKSSIFRDLRELPAIIEATQMTGKDVMEVGCGPGRLILPFARVAKTITAVDESDWTIKVVNDIVFEHRLKDRVQVVQSPLVSLPFDDSVADASYCMWIIHYNRSRWEKVVNEMVRVTKPGSPVVVGFSSGEKDLPRLEDIMKPHHLQKCKEFDVQFPKWIKDQGWDLDVKKIPLTFEFKSPDWGFEVFEHTFFPKKITDAQRAEAMAFLKQHHHPGKTRIEQEMRIYIIRAPNKPE